SIPFPRLLVPSLFGLLPRPCLAGSVIVNQGMVDDTAIARTDLHRRDVAIFGKAGGQYEDAKQVVAGGTDGPGLGDRQTHIRSAQLPAGGEVSCRRGFGGVTLRGAAVRPGAQRRDFLLGQSSLTVERTSFNRLPRRHAASACKLLDIRRPARCLAIGEEG